MSAAPTLVIIAGPNGAGKTSAAEPLIRETLKVFEFVNADTIARGLSGFSPESVAFPAGRIMLRRLGELAAARADFAFETTLASRSYLPWLRRLGEQGYRIHLLYLYVNDVQTCINRVARRVVLGGHDVPQDVIERRYVRSLRNFFSLYRHAVSDWRLYDNSAFPPFTIASSSRRKLRVEAAESWVKLEMEHG
jgi:predicted ABC-type ATPase